MEQLTIYYDKECRFCKNYVNYIHLQKKYDLALRNARERPAIIQAYKGQGYDIHQGMIVDHDDRIYHGIHAVIHIQRLMSGQRWRKRDITTYIGRPLYYFLNLLRKTILLLRKKDSWYL